ncbi:MAG: type IV pilin protein [Pseudomonadales bacterium]|nr:type IV pilin protein [Pseudomonadales bacterium]
MPANFVERGRRRAGAGFTLIEVMIVIVVVSILVAIALPSYESSMQKGRRTDAKSALLDVAGKQEQYMLDRGTYTNDMTDLGFAADPMVSEEQHYTLDATDCNGGTADLDRCYLITATPRAGSPQVDDARCTSFKLDSNGLKTATGSDIDSCW